MLWGSGEKEVVHTCSESLPLHICPLIPGYNKVCSTINLILSLFTLPGWRREWHIQLQGYVFHWLVHFSYADWSLTIGCSCEHHLLLDLHLVAGGTKNDCQNWLVQTSCCISFGKHPSILFFLVRSYLRHYALKLRTTHQWSQYHKRFWGKIMANEELSLTLSSKMKWSTVPKRLKNFAVVPFPGRWEVGLLAATKKTSAKERVWA